ncbi:hypothetical protein B0T11DRAFT_230466 [Plectosphaerella cucumerina]|uniref:Peptidyl-prolyl cis-trans isomerase n=1 Tax=Plectosphaerella cucumerina TaxID=40658 RepID=A0A8K0X086_9PEZI|nr:hypothetical protein B0T11DRAFT_230466 [Plectosphaerella cucumerina]
MGKDKNAGGKSAGKKGKGGGDDSKDSGGATKVKGAQSINVRHILCEKHSKKEEALAKIREGVKFDEVAREFSEDKARQGGSLGWKSRGSLDPKFEEIAFGLEASSTGSPSIGEAKTGFGYHIIMVSFGRGSTVKGLLTMEIGRGEEVSRAAGRLERQLVYGRSQHRLDPRNHHIAFGITSRRSAPILF